MATAAATSALQRGHVVCDASHLSMQAAWKLWRHLGSARQPSPSWNSDKHTAHSRRAADANADAMLR
jgi:hypothetical protein